MKFLHSNLADISWLVIDKSLQRNSMHVVPEFILIKQEHAYIETLCIYNRHFLMRRSLAFYPIKHKTFVSQAVFIWQRNAIINC